ncbi:MAG: biotin transporter BioY [Mangrovicoccus sp.]
MQSQPFQSSIKLSHVAGISAAVTAMIAGSHIEVPFYPVPMTLQTLAILSTGLVLGLRQGGIAIASFLGLGALGLPVFAGGKGGMAVFFGPTGGYLIGFALAVLFCGFARDRGWTRSLPGAAIVALIGAALVYPTGILQLGAVLGWDKPILEWGLTPFILGDVTKAFIAAFGVTLGARIFQR